MGRVKNLMLTKSTRIMVNENVWDQFKAYASHNLGMSASSALNIMMQGTVNADSVEPMFNNILEVMLKIRESAKDKQKSKG